MLKMERKQYQSKNQKMKKFKIVVKEVYEVEYTLEAETYEQACELIEDGEYGEQDTFNYLETLDSPPSISEIW